MRKMAFENVSRERSGLPKKEHSPAERVAAFMEAYDSTLAIIDYLRGIAPVYTIFGNVESTNAQTRQEAEEIGRDLPFLYDALMGRERVRIINNTIASIGGVRIGGLQYFVDTEWVESFEPSDYDLRLRRARRQTAKARRVLDWFGNVDILLCHQPPYGVLDKVTSKDAPTQWRGKRAGSPAIREYISRMTPRYVFCGHIHEGEGSARVSRTKVYNLGVCGCRIVEL